jgi:hypothetical protein
MLAHSLYAKGEFFNKVSWFSAFLAKFSGVVDEVAMGFVFNEPVN